MCTERGGQVIAKKQASAGQLCLGTCQPEHYITALDACLFESLIHKVKVRLLETFHGALLLRPS